MSQFEPIKRLLEEAGVFVHFTSDKMLSAQFSVGELTRDVHLFESDLYYVLMAVPQQPAALSLGEQDAAVLREIIRLQSKSSLTRIDFLEDEVSKTGIYVVLSECSADGTTGNKLRRRMEACAVLAAELETYFKSREG